MKRFHAIIASIALLGFSLPHDSSGLLFASTTLAAIPETAIENQLQSSVEIHGVDDVCISYTTESHHRENTPQCDDCSACIGRKQYIPGRDIKDNTLLSFAAFTNYINSFESKYESTILRSIEPRPLFAGARLHASTLIKLE